MKSTRNIRLRDIIKTGVADLKALKSTPSAHLAGGSYAKIMHMLNVWYEQRSQPISTYMMSDNAAQKWFDSLSPEKQKKYACLGLFMVAGLMTAGGLGVKHLHDHQNDPKHPTVIPKAEVYDPRADMLLFLQLENLTLDDVQEYLDNEPYAEMTGQRFPVKLKDMGDETFKAIMTYLINNDYIDKVKKRKKIK